MKNLFFILVLISISGCDNDFTPDCFQASGDIIQQEIKFSSFNKIIVFDRVQLIISQGDTQKVVLETGENLYNEIKIRVEDNILKIKDRNACNLVRNFGVTKVYVTSPDIIEIRNSSGSTVESRGVLAFEDLNLVSDDQLLEDEFHVDGDFKLDSLDVGIIRINSNGLSTFYLKGKARQAFFRLNDSDTRIEAGELEVQFVNLFHRSTNKMIVNPQQSIKGKIVSLGNVIAKNRPPIVEVEELYTGKLIFE
ncbi:MAG: hypothetical protein COA40_10200 [Aequorivita sp.]|nr:MAG: hypothetical protein COA40_10200 [Aequorivita sp.]